MKPKLTPILTIAALLVGIFINSSNGQAFTIESLDGNKQLIEVLPNYEKDILVIRCANDAIYIRDIIKLGTVQIVNKKFLLISYSIRSGVGMHVAKTLLLSISNHVMCESLHITSLFKEDFIDFSKSTLDSKKVTVQTNLKVDLNLTGSNKDNSKIKALIHDKRKSITEPKTNHSYDLITNLTFDRNRNIFCNSQENVSQYFTIVDAKTKGEAKQSIVGAFSVVKLGKQKYYYKEDKWYEWFDGNYLTQESYR